jgi:hypothetical protein
MNDAIYIRDIRDVQFVITHISISNVEVDACVVKNVVTRTRGKA